MTSGSEDFGNAIPAMPLYRRFQPKAILAGLGLLAAFDAGFYLLAVRPAAQRERATTARVAELVSQVSASQRNVDAVVQAADRLRQSDTDGSALVQEIAQPRRRAFSALLTELGAASDEANVEIRETSYDLEPVEGSEDYGILSVNAKFRGRYENLVRLLYQLDRSDLFFIIGSLTATPRDDSAASDLQIDLRFDTFVRDL